MSMFFLTSIIMVNAQTETNMTNMTSPTTLTKKELSLSIGELILESKTQSEGMKISDIDKQEFETSWSGNSTLQGEIPVGIWNSKDYFER